MEEKYIVIKYEWMDKHAIAYGELLIKGNPIIDNIIREINEEKEK